MGRFAQECLNYGALRARMFKLWGASRKNIKQFGRFAQERERFKIMARSANKSTLLCEVVPVSEGRVFCSFLIYNLFLHYNLSINYVIII